jgi:class 3 adenylate cyclase
MSARPAGAVLPSGTVTFLFTEVEGSTRLAARLGTRYGEVLVEHQRLLRQAFADAGGRELDTQGDAFFIVFERAKDAVAAALTAQRSLARHSWPDGVKVRVRIGRHTGEPAAVRDRYVASGFTARRGSALRATAVRFSSRARPMRCSRTICPATSRSATSASTCSRDLERPERIYQLVRPTCRRRLFLPKRSPPLLPAGCA